MSSRPGLSKSRVISQLQCPRRLWLEMNKPELAENSASSEAAMGTGNTVGDLARGLHPDGVLIEAESLREALRLTAQAIAARPRRPVFEATFEHDGVLVRADLLLPRAKGWRMVEVKSSTKVKDYHLDDAAIQSWVLNHAGVDLRDNAIAHVDTSFVYLGGGDYGGLLIEEGCDEAIIERLPEVQGWVDAARKTIRRRSEPGVEPGAQCNDPFACPFQGHCAPGVEGFPVEILPRGGKLAESLRDEGYLDLRDVPEERLSNPKHLRVWRAVRSGKAYRAPELRDAVSALPYPRVYIDFETINPAIPLWDGTRPYQQIPFQWSCHVQAKDGSTTHSAFLAEGSGDPRPDFIRTLLQAVGVSGPIVVWGAGFEGPRLLELAAAFPRHAAKLRKVAARLVDLLPLAREHYYHLAMMGSWSIKAVLGAVAPKLSYDGLPVANGGMAMEAFTRLLHLPPDTPEAEALRGNLLVYCERDTWAMVKLVEHFSKGSRK